MGDQPAAKFNADALASVTDLLKTLIGFATGALVVSAGLVTVQGISFLPWVKVVLAFSWVLLFFSAFFGVAAQSYVPRLIKNKINDINDGPLKICTMLMEGAFVLGILCLAVTFVSMLWSGPQKFNPTVGTPTAALMAAYNAICPSYRSDTVQTLEFVKNADGISGAWHVRLSGATSPRGLDVYVDAGGGRPVVYPSLKCAKGRQRR